MRNFQNYNSLGLPHHFLFRNDIFSQKNQFFSDENPEIQRRNTSEYEMGEEIKYNNHDMSTFECNSTMLSKSNKDQIKYSNDYREEERSNYFKEVDKYFSF